jgi:hypothetical protein
VITRCITRPVSVPGTTIPPMADDRQLGTVSMELALAERPDHRAPRWRGNCSPGPGRAAGRGRAGPAGGAAGGGVADLPAVAADPAAYARDLHFAAAPSPAIERFALA